MSADFETVVVGGGVVGLAIARALALAGHEVMLLERHDRVGTETSSRNSEVIHAGHLLSAGQLARQAVRRRQRAALSLLRRERRHPQALRQAAGGDAGSRASPSSRRIAAVAVKNGVDDLQRLERRRRARARARGRLRCRLSVAVDRDHRQPWADAGARRAHHHARRRRWCSTQPSPASRADGDDFTIETLSGGRARLLHGAQSRARGRPRRHGARPHAHLSGRLRRARDLSRARALLRARPAARRSAISSTRCRPAPGSACT